MNEPADRKEDKPETDADKQQRDAKRTETNRTDPQITELKGFFDPKEPLEEEGTINPLTGNAKDGER